MHYSWIDTIIIAWSLSYIIGGLRAGLIQSIGGVVGLFVGEAVASRTYEHYASWVAPVFGGNAIAGKIFAFILIFMLVTRLVALLFWFVNKLLNLIKIVPGLQLLNKVGGAVFGFLEASLFIGITLHFVVRLPISAHFAQLIHDSVVTPYFLAVSGWLIPLLPKVLKNSQNALDSVLPKGTSTNINVNSAVKTYNTIKNSGLVH